MPHTRETLKGDIHVIDVTIAFVMGILLAMPQDTRPERLFGLLLVIVLFALFHRTGKLRDRLKQGDIK